MEASSQYGDDLLILDTAPDAFSRFIEKARPPEVPAQLKRLLFQSGRPAVTALVEPHYIDIDYSASYYNQSGRSFTPSERATTRIHFFSSDRFSLEFVENPAEQNLKFLRDRYLGYVVVRPGTDTTLGRTFLSPPTDSEGKRAFFPTTGTFYAHIYGAELKVQACPFMSQDRRALACATASVWMSTLPLADKIGIRSFTTTEITAAALSLTRAYGPPLGQRGLSMPEMEHALIQMGFDPMLWEYPDVEQLLELCQLYTDNGMPPILGIRLPDGRGHAITVVGYTLDLASRRHLNELPKGSGVYPVTVFVPGLVAHDDQAGMYLDMKLHPADVEEHPFRTRVELSVRGKDRPEKKVGLCIFAVVPVPSRVMMVGIRAQRAAAFWLDYEKKHGRILARDLVVRTFLIRSNRYKTTLFPLGSKVPAAVCNAYRKLPMPRYVWVSEFAYLDDWLGREPTDLPASGELIFDSTAVSDTLNYLAFHRPGVVSIRRVVGQQVEKPMDITVPDDHAYEWVWETSRP